MEFINVLFQQNITCLQTLNSNLNIFSENDKTWNNKTIIFIEFGNFTLGHLFCFKFCHLAGWQWQKFVLWDDWEHDELRKDFFTHHFNFIIAVVLQKGFFQVFLCLPAYFSLFWSHETQNPEKRLIPLKKYTKILFNIIMVGPCSLLIWSMSWVDVKKDTRRKEKCEQVISVLNVSFVYFLKVNAH